MEFRVLGPIEVLDQGQPVVLGGPKQRAVLALLVLRANRVVSVDHLIDALWGEEAAVGAPKTLQVYIAGLRRALEPERTARGAGERIRTQPPGYCLVSDVDDVDLLRFERLADEGRQALASRDPATASARLGEALGLWRGPALADLAYESFVQAELGGLEERRLAAVEDRIESELALGSHRALVGELEELVRSHPLRERLQGQLMLALYRAGRQAEALRAYGTARRALVDELGIEPTLELRALEQAILAQDHSLTLDAEAVEGPPRTRQRSGEGLRRLAPLPWQSDAPFVGRGDELERLHAAWDAVKQGQVGTRVALVRGEAGIGKTQLAARFAGAAAEEGATVLFGRCDEETIRPYQPFAEALSRFLHSLPTDRYATAVSALSPRLARLMPEVDALDDGAAAPAIDDPASERFELFEDVASLIESLDPSRPTVFVIDDLQWADAGTTLLTQHLVRRTSAAPTLFLLTLRDTYGPENAPVARLLMDLRRQGVLERLGLWGLSEVEIEVLLRAPGGADVAWDPGLARVLYARTDGNPFFIGEILRHWAEIGRTDEAAVPDDVQELISQRLSQLSDESGRMLAAASVAGPDFPIDVLELVAALDGDQLVETLEEAEAAGIVKESSASPARYRFVHLLVRDAVYGRLSAVRRTRLHERVGSALEQLNGFEPGPHVAELALHFSCAGVGVAAEKAVRYARLAGDLTMAQLAYEEASRLYLVGLEALGHLRHDSSDNERVRLQYSAVLALARSGATARALALLESLGLHLSNGIELPPDLAEDVAALEARLAKDEAIAATGPDRQANALRSAELYEAICNRLDRPYSCINAATMWLLAGDRERSAALARRTQALCSEMASVSSQDAYWQAATQAEAALLLGEDDVAADALRRATKEPAADRAMRRSTSRQLEVVCGLTGIDRAVLAPLDDADSSARPTD